MIAWLGNALIVIGMIRIGNRKRDAFLFSIAGEAAYVQRSYVAGDWALFSVCLVFLGMAARNYIKWGRD